MDGKDGRESIFPPQRATALGTANSERPDCVADDAVSCELVSAPNSLLTGKLTATDGTYPLGCHARNQSPVKLGEGAPVHKQDHAKEANSGGFLTPSPLAEKAGHTNWPVAKS